MLLHMLCRKHRLSNVVFTVSRSGGQEAKRGIYRVDYHLLSHWPVLTAVKKCLTISNRLKDMNVDIPSELNQGSCRV